MASTALLFGLVARLFWETARFLRLPHWAVIEHQWLLMSLAALGICLLRDRGGCLTGVRFEWQFMNASVVRVLGLKVTEVKTDCR